MSVRIKKGKAVESIIHTVEERSGTDLRVCYQCKKCTSGCPVADSTTSPPSEIIRKLHLGIGEELLESDIIWMCTSCETCSARCPMEIDIAAVIDSLRALAVEKKAPTSKGNVPLFNRAFLGMVKIFGRSYDLAMIAAYKIGTLTFMNDAEKFPAMLKKRKIALLPPRGANRQTVKRIFNKVLKDKRNGK